MTTNILDTYAELAATIALQNTAIADKDAEIAALIAENNALKATNIVYENTMRAIHRDVPMPARARLDRLFGKCTL